MENVFVNGMIPKKAKFEFIALNLAINVKEFSNFLIEHRDYIEANKGWLNIDIMKSKKDADKLYAKFTKLEKRAEVKAVNHMPDRETTQQANDLPF
jgi:hypothetical protein